MLSTTLEVLGLMALAAGMYLAVGIAATVFTCGVELLLIGFALGRE